MKKITTIQLLLALVFGLAFLQCSNNNKKMQDAMEKEAKIVNAQCPVMLNDETRLDNCQVFPDKIFRYNYTMLAMTAGVTDTVELKNKVKPEMVKLIKTQTQMDVYRENDIIFQYRYNDSDGNYILQINVGPEDYK